MTCTNFKAEYTEIQKLQSWWHWILGLAVPALFFFLLGLFSGYVKQLLEIIPFQQPGVLLLVVLFCVV